MFQFTSFDFFQTEQTLQFTEFVQTSSNYVSIQLFDALTTATTKFNDIIIKKNSKVSTETSNTPLQDPFQSIPVEISSYIVSFLTAEELSNYSRVNTFSRLTFQRLIKETSGYWHSELMRRYLSSSVIPPSPSTASTASSALIHNLSYLNYLQSNLIESQSEFRHFQSLQNHYQAIHIYNQKNSSWKVSVSSSSSGIIGLVCDIAWTDSPLLSAVLSKKRYMTMSTILTHSISDVHKFKKVIQSDVIRSFLPIRSTTPSFVDPDLVKVQSNDLIFPGFIGYAVNLIRLPEEFESLRYTVFWGLFRDLMVFDNRTSSELFSRTLSADEMLKFWVVTLTDYSEEVLQEVYPRLSSKVQRKNYSEMNCEDVKERLEMNVENAIVSYSIGRCTY